MNDNINDMFKIPVDAWGMAQYTDFSVPYPGKHFPVVIIQSCSNHIFNILIDIAKINKTLKNIVNI